MMINRFVLILTLALSLGCKKDPSAPSIINPTIFTPVETEDIVMYEVNLRAFSTQGDINGLRARLAEIGNLGVNTLWIMPIHSVGQINSAGGLGSPYSVQDYRGIGAEYGTLSDFKALVSQAHARGMAVLLDWVANHTSWDHAWISQHPEWYTQDANGTILHPPGTNWLDVADLNYNNQLMRNAMIADMRYWTEEVGIDGFRCDAADMVPFDFWKQAIDSIRTKANKKIIMLAEGARADHMEAGFDLNFSWNYYTQLKNAYQNGSGTVALWSAHRAEYTGFAAGQHRLRFITNHDEYAWDNTPSVLFGGEKAAFSAFALTSLWSPVVLIYNGQEIGWPSKIPFFTKSPLNWSYNINYRILYEQFMMVRKSNPALYKGTLTPVQLLPLTAFTRVSGTDTFLILINTRNRVDSLTLPVGWQDDKWTSVNNSLVPVNKLDPFEVKIWKRM